MGQTVDGRQTRQVNSSSTLGGIFDKRSKKEEELRQHSRGFGSESGPKYVSLESTYRNRKQGGSSRSGESKKEEPKQHKRNHDDKATSSYIGTRLSDRRRETETISHSGKRSGEEAERKNHRRSRQDGHVSKSSFNHRGSSPPSTYKEPDKTLRREVDREGSGRHSHVESARSDSRAESD